MNTQLAELEPRLKALEEQVANLKQNAPEDN
jgi:hypothetical protein